MQNSKHDQHQETPHCFHFSLELLCSRCMSSLIIRQCEVTLTAEILGHVETSCMMLTMPPDVTQAHRNKARQ